MTMHPLIPDIVTHADLSTSCDTTLTMVLLPCIGGAARPRRCPFLLVVGDGEFCRHGDRRLAGEVPCRARRDAFGREGEFR